MTVIHPRKLTAQVTRLRVFQYLKMIMDREGRVPTGDEVAAFADVSTRVANSHMRALDGAAGLSLRIPTRGERFAEGGFIHAEIGRNTYLKNHGHSFDPNTLPLDKLVGNDHA
jgi:hypothetical protein